jgi:proteasome lid subunit RPN8/RPN11
MALTKKNDLAIWIKERHWNQMLSDVLAQAPREACGLLAGWDRISQEVYPVENILQSETRYRMNPEDQLRIFSLLEDQEMDLLAIYHSHPLGPPTPSRTDLEAAGYPEAVNLIWSPGLFTWNCRGFLIKNAEALEVPVFTMPKDS